MTIKPKCRLVERKKGCSLGLYEVVGHNQRRYKRRLRCYAKTEEQAGIGTTISVPQTGILPFGEHLSECQVIVPQALKFAVEEHLQLERSMSRGLGRIQREALRVIAEYEAAGKRPTTFTIAAEIYQVSRDENGNRTINDAQHTSVKRALSNLRRKGLVTGKQDIAIDRNGKWVLRIVGADGMHAERCCLWTLR